MPLYFCLHIDPRDKHGCAVRACNQVDRLTALDYRYVEIALVRGHLIRGAFDVQCGRKVAFGSVPSHHVAVAKRAAVVFRVSDVTVHYVECGCPRGLVALRCDYALLRAMGAEHQHRGQTASVGNANGRGNSSRRCRIYCSLHPQQRPSAAASSAVKGEEGGESLSLRHKTSCS